MPVHVPVLLGHTPSVLQILKPCSGETVVDVTLGLGGHTVAFAEAVGPHGRIIALDADEENIKVAKEKLHSFLNRVSLYHRNFREIASLSLSADIVFADLGLSSPHIDNPERGFSFRHTAPLDLRFDRTQGMTAAEWLSQESEEGICSVLRAYGEIDRAKQLSTILSDVFKKKGSSGTTDDVSCCVEKIFTYKAPRVLPQVFQAFRIYINDELGSLRLLLEEVPKILKKGGRCGIISYHSLEDRMVKHVFKALATPVLDSLTGAVATPAKFEILTRKAVQPSEEEIAHNPRSRSAKFRALLKR